MAAPRTIKLTPKERLAQSREFWVPPGTPVEVRGRTIVDGMIYVGSGIGALSVNEPVEPAAIDPAHKGARRSRQRSSYSYGWTYDFPGFARLTHEEQEQFLDWLAAGRPKTEISDFLWIFFYGLERRLMFDGRQDAVAKSEELRLLDEIERLRDHNFDVQYGNFYNAATALLLAVKIRSGTFDFDADTLPLIRHSDTWSIRETYALAISYVLGVCAADERPLPSNWALAWILERHHRQSGRVAMERFPEQTRALFLHAYRQQFGEGIILHKGYWEDKLAYHPSSPSFSSMLKIGDRKLPVFGSYGTYPPKLTQLLDDVISEIELFNRAVGSQTDEISAIALGFLPEGLVGLEQHPALAPIIAALEAYLGEQHVTLLPMHVIFELFPQATPRPTPKQATAMARILKRVGFGIEPNPAIDRPAFQRSIDIGLYRIDASVDQPAQTKPETSPTALVALLTLAASDDGRVSQPSQQAVREVAVSRSDLDPNNQRQLEAFLAWQLRHPPSFVEAKRGFGSPSAWNLDHVRQDLMTVVAADGPPPPLRIKELSRIYKVLGLDSKQMHADLHRVSTGSIAHSIESNPNAGFAISRESHEIVLDPNRLGIVQQDTEAIANLLDDVFRGEAEARLPNTSQNDSVIDPYVQLIAQLASSPTWEMSEMTTRASALGLMASGAIETINHRATVLGLEPPIECDDSTCDIDHETLKELLAHV